jgi:hypothetical protein
MASSRRRPPPVPTPSPGRRCRGLAAATALSAGYGLTSPRDVLRSWTAHPRSGGGCSQADRRKMGASQILTDSCDQIVWPVPLRRMGIPGRGWSVDSCGRGLSGDWPREHGQPGGPASSYAVIGIPGCLFEPATAGRRRAGRVGACRASRPRRCSRCGCRRGWQRPNGVVTVRTVAMVRSYSNRGWPDSKRIIRSFGDNRICAARRCATRLSRYNPDDFCFAHRGQVPPQPVDRHWQR